MQSVVAPLCEAVLFGWCLREGVRASVAISCPPPFDAVNDGEERALGERAEPVPHEADTDIYKGEGDEGDDEAPATDALPVTSAQHALDPRGQAPRFAEGDDECSYLDDAAHSTAEESPEGEEQDDCPQEEIKLIHILLLSFPAKVLHPALFPPTGLLASRWSRLYR